MNREIFWTRAGLWRCLSLIGEEKCDSMSSSRGCEAFPGHSGHAEGWASGNAAVQGSSRHFVSQTIAFANSSFPAPPPRAPHWETLGTEPWDKIPA